MPLDKRIIGAGSIGVNLRWDEGMPDRADRIILLGRWENIWPPGHSFGAIN